MQGLSTGKLLKANSLMPLKAVPEYANSNFESDPIFNMNSILAMQQDATSLARSEQKLRTQVL